MTTKTKLKGFRIHNRTKFGFGLFDIRAKDFQDAFKRLSKHDKLAFITIEDLETNEHKTFTEIFND